MSIFATLLIASTSISALAANGNLPVARRDILALRGDKVSPKSLISFCITDPPQSKCPSRSSAVKLYRLFQNDAELYRLTTRSVEKTRAFDEGYEFDGVAARVFEKENALTSPFYHVYNPHTQDSFYTVDQGERDEALRDRANIDNGVAAHVFARRVCGSKPLYRLYNPAIKSHFYTIDEDEVDEAVRDKGYEGPAISAFVLPK
ncbi:hypothetical protein B0H11DRAFT_1725870 [Mycena galericulata]|nr:hypothetical protein B0H11DRAFT_1725870 [Mycena galericulata]